MMFSINLHACTDILLSSKDDNVLRSFLMLITLLIRRKDVYLSRSLLLGTNTDNVTTVETGHLNFIRK